MAEDSRIQQDLTGVGDRLPAKDDSDPSAPALETAGLTVPWSGPEILAVLFVGSLWPSLVYQFLLQVGWYRWFYGAAFLERLQNVDAAREMISFRLGLWSICAALPLQVGSALLILRVLSGTRPADAGLTGRRLGKNLLAGLVAALVWVPGVYGIYALVLLLFQYLGGPTQEHPFTELSKQSLQPMEWVLLVLAATVVAPVWEELFFRGIVQPWVITRPRGGPIALLAALVWTLVARSDSLKSSLGKGGTDLLVELTPVLVLLALTPGYFLLARRSRPMAGVFAAALLFAWVHARVWPSPIPLVWLALGLGWLALRTRSLAGPIVLHGLFNGVACFVLLWPVVRGAPG